MPNDFYGRGRQAFATAQVNWPIDAINVTLVDLADYTVSLGSDQFYAAIPAAARIAAVALTGMTANLGVLVAANATMPTVTGDQAEALVIWKNTGSDATSPLLLFIDQATGLPVIPNGGDIDIEWNAAGIGTL